MAQVIEPTDANFLGKAFGGSLLARIDLCAYVTASKFAETICVTASFDRVDFLEPIEVGELVTMVGSVSYVGRTSVEVTIHVVSENVLTGVRRNTNTARVTMVAFRDGKPAEVPRLICETREDKITFLAGKYRRERRNLQREEFDRMMAELTNRSESELDALLEKDKLTT